ncbi:hypothetical protein F4782DRAFT_525326 [Xylaria castorea]|nr:hypothetical protein F4782DRAFT_525326 [Xylaria castorea]
MGKRYGQDDSPTSYNMTSKTQRNRLKDIPHSEDYIPVREAHLQRIMIESLAKQPLKSDRDISQYEDYLREKWHCTEAMPDSFDPCKLEAVMKSRFPSKSRHGESSETPKPISQNTTLEDESSHISTDIYSCECNAPHDSLFSGPANQSLDTDEQLEDDGSEIAVDNLEILIDDVTSVWSQSNLNTISRDDQTLLETSERALTPRIGVGSKPPLSRSAFVEGGVFANEGCQCKKKPPKYFPFQGRVRRQSKSK